MSDPVTYRCAACLAPIRPGDRCSCWRGWIVEQVEPAANDLVAWLNVQIDTDERLAREATPGPWRWTDPGGNLKFALVGADRQMIVPSARPDGYPSVADAAHIACWDPQRALAEVESKRRIVAECEADLRQRGDGALDGDVDRPTWDVLRLLTVAYRHRDGWQEEWAQ